MAPAENIHNTKSVSLKRTGGNDSINTIILSTTLIYQNLIQIIMGFFDFLNGPLDTVFRPIINSVDPFWFVLGVSVILALMIVVVYKFATNQNLMKQLKTEIKELQKQMKTLKDQPDKMMEVQKRMMKTNTKYMMQSFKASFITLIPIFIIYAYLNGAIAFDPINPMQEFSVSVMFEDGVFGNITTTTPERLEITGETTKTISDGELIFTYKGPPGKYLIQFEKDSKKYAHEVLISMDRKYAPPLQDVGDGIINVIQTNLNKTIVMNLFGWKLGWFGSYIIFSIAFSMLFRKLFKVY